MLRYIDFTDDPVSSLMDYVEELLLSFSELGEGVEKHDAQGISDYDAVSEVNQERRELLVQLAAYYSLALRLDLAVLKPEYRLRMPVLNRQVYQILSDHWRLLSAELTIDTHYVQEYYTAYQELEAQRALLGELNEADPDDVHRLYHSIQEQSYELVDEMILETLSLSTQYLMWNLSEGDHELLAKLHETQSMLAECLEHLNTHPELFLSITDEVRDFRSLLHASALETDRLVSELLRYFQGVHRAATQAELGQLSTTDEQIWRTFNQLDTLPVVIIDPSVENTRRALTAGGAQSLHEADADDIEPLKTLEYAHCRVHITEYIFFQDDGSTRRVGLRVEAKADEPLRSNITLRESASQEMISPFFKDTEGMFFDYEVTHYQKLDLLDQEYVFAVLEIT